MTMNLCKKSLDLLQRNQYALEGSSLSRGSCSSAAQKAVTRITGGETPMSRLKLTVLAIFLAHATACGGGGGGGGGGGSTLVIPNSAAIGPSGGTVVAQGGTINGSSVDIPAGALAVTTTVVIAAGNNIANGIDVPVGAPVHYGPSGTQFSPPATVKIPFNPALIPAGRTSADIFVNKRDDGSGSVSQLTPTNIDTTNNFVSAQTSSFSTFQAAVIPPPTIAVTTQSSLNFGALPINSTAVIAFRVANSGGGTLSGAASVGAPFSIVGTSSYSLTAAQSVTITVRYQPVAAVTTTANVTFTGGGGATRAVTGTGLTRTLVLLYSVFPRDGIDKGMRDDLNEIEKALFDTGGSPAVRIYAHLSQTGVSINGSTTAKTIQLGPDSNLGAIGAQTTTVLDHGSEQVYDSTSVPNVVAFASDALTRFPADRLMFIFSGHGDGHGGACPDNNAVTGNDRFTIEELEQICSQVAQVYGKPIDLLAFDCCLMANFEAGYQIRSNAKLLIACEETMIGFAYDLWLPTLLRNPNVSPENTGRSICDTYAATSTKTVSVLDLSRMTNVQTALSSLATSLMNNQFASAAAAFAFYRARSATDGFHPGACREIQSEPQFRDLSHFCRQLQQQANVAVPVSQAATVLLNEIDQLTVHNVVGPEHASAEGLSIELRNPRGSCTIPGYYSSLASSTNGTWDNLLTFQDPATLYPSGSKPTLSQTAARGMTNPRPAAPGAIDYGVTGLDKISRAEFVAATELAGALTYIYRFHGQYLWTDTLPGSAFTLSFDGQVLQLRDGSGNAAYLDFQPVALNSWLGFAKVQLTDPGGSLDAYLVLSAEPGFEAILQVIVISPTTGQYFALPPSAIPAGTTIETYYVEYDWNIIAADTVTEQLDSARVLVLGSGGLGSLTLSRGPLLTTGTFYVVGTVFDPAGNSDQEWTPFTR